jgi:mRNA-degrading endonuclease YafQ of YafQ-DinJ toxin-antitoxin module
MFTLHTSEYFKKKYQKLTKDNSKLKENLKKALKLLETDPFSVSLKTHKVNTKNNFLAYSSRVTGDIRIIWNFEQEKANILDLIDLGGHSGSSKVYK